MNMYLNYAGEHWTKENENPPLGLILCTGTEKILVKYTLQGISNKIMTADHTTKLLFVIGFPVDFRFLLIGDSFAVGPDFRS